MTREEYSLPMLRPADTYIAPVDADKVAALVDLVTDSVQSPHSKRAYRRAIRDFLSWYRETGQIGLSKAVVARYAATLAAQGMGASSINQRLCALRSLAREAADNDVLSAQAAGGIERVKGIRQKGQRLGLWLSREQAQRLLDTPDTTTLSGLRDRAMLATMLGCGLRRSEVAALTFSHIQRRNGHWLIVDLVGKGQRMRSIVMPDWCKDAVGAWATAADLVDGPVFRNVTKGDTLRQYTAAGDGLTPEGVSWIVKRYAADLGMPALAAHDLRRSYAKLGRAGGAALEQIQLSLGHASLTTTERYLGHSLDMDGAPGDKTGLGL